jgi:hypothetical protein
MSLRAGALISLATALEGVVREYGLRHRSIRKRGNGCRRQGGGICRRRFTRSNSQFRCETARYGSSKVPHHARRRCLRWKQRSAD